MTSCMAGSTTVTGSLTRAATITADRPGAPSVAAVAVDPKTGANSRVRITPAAAGVSQATPSQAGPGSQTDQHHDRDRGRQHTSGAQQQQPRRRVRRDGHQLVGRVGVPAERGGDPRDGSQRRHDQEQAQAVLPGEQSRRSRRTG